VTTPPTTPPTRQFLAAVRETSQRLADDPHPEFIGQLRGNAAQLYEELRAAGIDPTMPFLQGVYLGLCLALVERPAGLAEFTAWLAATAEQVVGGQDLTGRLEQGPPQVEVAADADDIRSLRGAVLILAGRILDGEITLPNPDGNDRTPGGPTS
jgi:hypothetical protein